MLTNKTRLARLNINKKKKKTAKTIGVNLQVDFSQGWILNLFILQLDGF